MKKEIKVLNGKGHSDTEILIELIESFGLEKALTKCVGMFALALWDRKEKCLVLARDRMGEKPLYYGFSGTSNKKTFLFASELSAIKNGNILRMKLILKDYQSLLIINQYQLLIQFLKIFFS